MSLVLGLGLEHSCPWPRECLSSERLSLALALASDFFCVLGLGLGLEPCVLDSTSDKHDIKMNGFSNLVVLVHGKHRNVSQIPESRYYFLSRLYFSDTALKIFWVHASSPFGGPCLYIRFIPQAFVAVPASSSGDVEN